MSYKKITDAGSHLLGYRFVIAIPKGISRSILTAEPDWIVSAIEKELPKEEYAAMSRRGYTIRNEKMGLAEATIRVLLDEEEKEKR